MSITGFEPGSSSVGNNYSATAAATKIIFLLN